MKKLSFVSVLMLGLFLMSVTVNATGLRTEFSEFEISPVNDLFLGKSVQKVWTLSYSQNEVPVTVVKHKTVEGVEYTVHSEHFEVSYASVATGFGVREVRKSWSNVPKKINNAVLNQAEMKNQQIITPNKVSDEVALGLIASYLPDLLNDGYTHLLN
ncbi:MAG: hypothetical protein EOM73_03430 [Bacteroidia bacterium]|nr:hypothetical protein [Bacteroidia bacterium]